MVHKRKIGHLLLIRYKHDPVAFLIRTHTRGYWNHVAWIWRGSALIESKGLGVMISKIDKYNNPKKFKTKVLKIKKLSIKEQIKMEDFLVKSCTKKLPYINQIITFLLVFLNFKGPLPKYTCSGLIAGAFNSIGRSFCSKQPSLTTPEDINRSKETKNA